MWPRSDALRGHELSPASAPTLPGSKAETNQLIEAVSRSFHEHRLKWARVRYGDEERVFKANGHRPG